MPGLFQILLLVTNLIKNKLSDNIAPLLKNLYGFLWPAKPDALRSLLKSVTIYLPQLVFPLSTCTLCSSHSGTCPLCSPILFPQIYPVQFPQLKLLFPLVSPFPLLMSMLVETIAQFLEEKWSFQDSFAESCPHRHLPPSEINHFTMGFPKHCACIFKFHVCNLHHAVFSGYLCTFPPSQVDYGKMIPAQSFYMVKCSIHTRWIVCFY